MADARKKNEKDFARGFWVVLGSSTGAQVREWMLANGVHDVNHAMRMLCSVGMSSMPDLAVLSNERKIAYDKMRAWFITESYTFLNQMYYRMRKMEGELSYLKAGESDVPETNDVDLITGELK